MTEILPRAGNGLATDGAMRLLLDLEAAGACTPVALDLTNVALTFERFAALLALLGAIKRRTSWYIGDALNEGERLFGEEVAQAAEALGMSPGTLTNYRWVASRVPPQRRLAELSFSTHEPVARLGPREQRQWLGRALKEGWTRDRLRAALRDADALPVPSRVALGEAERAARVRLEGAARDVVGAAKRRGGGWWVPEAVWVTFVEAV